MGRIQGVGGGRLRAMGPRRLRAFSGGGASGGLVTRGLVFANSGEHDAGQPNVFINEWGGANQVLGDGAGSGRPTHTANGTWQVGGGKYFSLNGLGSVRTMMFCSDRVGYASSYTDDMVFDVAGNPVTIYSSTMGRWGWGEWHFGPLDRVRGPACWGWTWGSSAKCIINDHFAVARGSETIVPDGNDIKIGENNRSNEDWYGMAFYSVELTEEEIAQNYAYFAALNAARSTPIVLGDTLPKTVPYILAEGDSRINWIPVNGEFGKTIQGLLGDSAVLHCHGIDGQAASGLTTEATYRNKSKLLFDRAIANGATHVVLVIWCGINSLRAGTTSASILTSYQTRIDQFKADYPSGIVIVLQEPDGNPNGQAGFTTQKLLLATGCSDTLTNVDAVIPLSDADILGNPYDAGLFVSSDGVHPGGTGFTMIGNGGLVPAIWHLTGAGIAPSGTVLSTIEAADFTFGFGPGLTNGFYSNTGLSTPAADGDQVLGLTHAGTGPSLTRSTGNGPIYKTNVVGRNKPALRGDGTLRSLRGGTVADFIGAAGNEWSVLIALSIPDIAAVWNNHGESEGLFGSVGPYNIDWGFAEVIGAKRLIYSGLSGGGQSHNYLNNYASNLGKYTFLAMTQSAGVKARTLGSGTWMTSTVGAPDSRADQFYIFGQWASITGDIPLMAFWKKKLTGAQFDEAAESMRRGLGYRKSGGLGGPRWINLT